MKQKYTVNLPPFRQYGSGQNNLSRQVRIPVSPSDYRTIGAQGQLGEQEQRGGACLLHRLSRRGWNHGTICVPANVATEGQQGVL